MNLKEQILEFIELTGVPAGLNTISNGICVSYIKVDPVLKKLMEEGLIYCIGHKYALDKEYTEGTDMLENQTQLTSDEQFNVETFAKLDNSDIESTLKERGSRYGDFKEHARITKNIKRALADSPNWGSLSDDKQEALDMLAHKLGRILNGDPEYHDSWYDCIGYLKLIENTLIEQ